MKIVTERIDFLVRFSDKLYSIEDTVVEHKKVVEQYGAVWFGKVGKTLSEKFLTKLNEQCEKDITTYLILVQRVGRTYDAFRCKIAKVSTEKPENEWDMVPEYYKKMNIDKQVSLWAKIVQIEHMENDVFNKLRVLSSGSKVKESLERSMAGLFIVH